MKLKCIFLLGLFYIGTVLGRSNKTDESFPASPFQSYGAGPTYFINYTNFAGIGNKTYVKFYLQVSYDELQFYKNQGLFRAGYNIELTVVDENKTVVEHYSNQDVIAVKTYMETQDVKKMRIFLIGYSLNPGRYKIKSTVTDVETKKTSKIEDAFHDIDKQFTDYTATFIIHDSENQEVTH